MTTYAIASKTSGALIGHFEGATEDDALDALAREQGYANFADAALAGFDLDYVRWMANDAQMSEADAKAAHIARERWDMDIQVAR